MVGMSEYLIPISIEYLEESRCLATSSVLQGLIAQSRTIAETIEIAEDVARKILESCIEHGERLPKNLKVAQKPYFKLNVKIPVPVETRYASCYYRSSWPDN
jgi:antitoxin HicB